MLTRRRSFENRVLFSFSFFVFFSVERPFPGLFRKRSRFLESEREREKESRPRLICSVMSRRELTSRARRGEGRAGSTQSTLIMPAATGANNSIIRSRSDPDRSFRLRPLARAPSPPLLPPPLCVFSTPSPSPSPSTVSDRFAGK